MEELISVILPVYNAAEFVKASVESILSQTYSNFELIIIDDGSTDSSAAILKTISDKRIVIVSQSNAGIAAALNKGISLAKGKYIARQDADDISLPDRFEKQVKFLEENSAYGLVGGWARVIDASGKATGRFLKHDISNVKLQYDLLWNSPFVHPTVMFRKTCIDSAGEFYTGKDFFEDYDMWSRMARSCKLANLPEIVLDYRELSTGLSFSTKNSSDRVINQRKKNIAALFPSLEKEIVEALALSGKKRTRISSLNKLREIYRMFLAYFESIGAKPGEMNLIQKDFAERLHTFVWLSGETKNVFYYPGRLLEKIFYPKP